MNYKANKDDELLLLSATWSDNVVLPNNRSDDISRATQPLPPNVRDSTSRGNDDRYPVYNSDTQARSAHLASETPQEVDVDGKSVANNVSADSWVSFDDNARHFDVASQQETAAVQSGNDTQWTVFDTLFTQRQSECQQTCNKEVLRNDQGLSSGQETDLTPFDNCELDQIQHDPSKQLNNACQPNTPVAHHRNSPKIEETGVSHTNVMRPSMDNDIQDYPTKPTNRSWSLWLRYPDLKRKFRPREWKSVVVKLSGSILQVYQDLNASEPYREVSLQCFYQVTAPKLQQFHGRKVHTVKLLYVKYKEMSKKLVKTSNALYMSKATPILKLASSSHLVVQEFVNVVIEALRLLPVYRDRGISHHTEAVYINVHDNCSALLDPSGKVVRVGILVRIHLRAFVSGDAECMLVLNDARVKSEEEARLREEHMPQRIHKWIDIEKCDFHNTVSMDTYNQTHSLVFQPLDSCMFEIVQFRVKQLKPLPLVARCSIVVDEQRTVELHAEVKLCSDPKLAKYERKNICLYFSVPDAWMVLFMMHKMFRGETSIKSTSSRKAIKLRNKVNRPPCTIEVTTGVAQYEPEYKAIVWRIDQLPMANASSPADSSHDFTCYVQTPEAYHGLPGDYKPHCVLEYEIPYTVASDTNIVNFKVSGQKVANQEVTYNAYYSYDLQVKVTHLDEHSSGNRWIHD